MLFQFKNFNNNNFNNIDNYNNIIIIIRNKSYKSSYIYGTI